MRSSPSSTLDFDSATEARYRAAVTSLPVAPLLLHVAADAPLRAALQAALEADAHSVRPSPTRPAPRATPCRRRASTLALVQRESGLLIQAAPLDARQSARAAEALRPAIKQVAQWERLLALRNRASDIDAASIDFVCTEAAEGGAKFTHPSDEVTLESVQQRDGQWSEIKAKLKVRNRSGRTLHMVLAYFSPAYGVQMLRNDPIESGDAWVTLWGDDPSNAFRLVEDGEREETIDRFKLIASTEKRR